VQGGSDPNSSSLETFRLPPLLWIWGVSAICGSAALTARIVWEETVWTWRSGPQMLGFSLAHGSGAILLLLPLLLIAWVAVVVALIARNLLKRRAIQRQVWIILGLAGLVFGVLSLPYGLWQRVFVSRLVAKPHPGEFLTYAAATGDLGTVKALLSHGLSVSTTDRQGRTGLHAAAATGRMNVLQYLVSHRADLNAIDRFGDSPLEVASSGGQNQAAKFLTDRGAKQIRGDDVQRQNAIREIVREDIERMH
jgi:hypothetical protein